ncbi:hypothetical protein H671_7g18175 [Cricetulus griseus]|nr:hypothetical protein H671_7g18175 [Cricetulus griseus]
MQAVALPEEIRWLLEGKNSGKKEREKEGKREGKRKTNRSPKGILSRIQSGLLGCLTAVTVSHTPFVFNECNLLRSAGQMLKTSWQRVCGMRTSALVLRTRETTFSGASSKSNPATSLCLKVCRGRITFFTYDKTSMDGSFRDCGERSPAAVFDVLS